MPPCTYKTCSLATFWNQKMHADSVCSKMCKISFTGQYQSVNFRGDCTPLVRSQLAQNGTPQRLGVGKAHLLRDCFNNVQLVWLAMAMAHRLHGCSMLTAVAQRFSLPPFTTKILYICIQHQKSQGHFNMSVHSTYRPFKISWICPCLEGHPQYLEGP